MTQQYAQARPRAPAANCVICLAGLSMFSQSAGQPVPGLAPMSPLTVLLWHHTLFMLA